MFIQTEQTPNPQTLKFLPGKVVMDEGTAFYQNIDEAGDSPFARRLFAIEGVSGVFFGSDFITITKSDSYEWQVMKPSVLGGIIDHFNSEDKTVEKEAEKEAKKSLQTNEDDSDIIYDDFADGVVYLKMQGACSGCPSSTATLKMGIENMLKHYIPEVQEVRPVDA